MNTKITGSILFVGAFIILIGIIAFPKHPETPPVDNLVPLEITEEIKSANIIALMNQDRIALGLQPLKENTKLDTSAKLKGDDMVSKGYFAHSSPDGDTPWITFSQVGYSYVRAGENLGVTYTEHPWTVQQLESAWMDSPTHRQNVLNPFYTEVGVYVVEGKKNDTQAIFVVVHFGMPN